MGGGVAVGVSSGIGVSVLVVGVVGVVEVVCVELDWVVGLVWKR